MFTGKVSLGAEVRPHLDLGYGVAHTEQRGAPYRSVSLGERVLNDLSRQAAHERGANLPSLKDVAAGVLHQASGRVVPLLPMAAQDVLKLGQVLRQEIHTTNGKTYSGLQALASAGMYEVLGQGNAYVDAVPGLLPPSIKTDIDPMRVASLGEMAGMTLTPGFALGVGGAVTDPAFLKFIRPIKTTAKILLKKVETIADLKGQVDVLSGKLAKAMRDRDSALEMRKAATVQLELVGQSTGKSDVLPEVRARFVMHVENKNLEAQKNLQLAEFQMRDLRRQLTYMKRALKAAQADYANLLKTIWLQIGKGT